MRIRLWIPKIVDLGIGRLINSRWIRPCNQKRQSTQIAPTWASPFSPWPQPLHKAAAAAVVMVVARLSPTRGGNRSAAAVRELIITCVFDLILNLLARLPAKGSPTLGDRWRGTLLPGARSGMLGVTIPHPAGLPRLHGAPGTQNHDTPSPALSCVCRFHPAQHTPRHGITQTDLLVTPYPLCHSQFLVFPHLLLADKPLWCAHFSLPWSASVLVRLNLALSFNISF